LSNEPAVSSRKVLESKPCLACECLLELLTEESKLKAASDKAHSLPKWSVTKTGMQLSSTHDSVQVSLAALGIG
jgi:hypothetical protein